MTFAIYFTLFVTLFFAVLNILPVAGALSTSFASSIVYMVSFMVAWNSLLPITELLYCVTAVTLFEIGIRVWYFIRWVIITVRGAGSNT